MIHVQRNAALIFCILSASMLVPQTAFADMVWPALYLESRYFFAKAVGLGLLLEWPVVKVLTRLSPFESFKATLVANLISALVGVPLTPVIGFLVEFLHLGTTSMFTWAASGLGIAVLTSGIEFSVLKQRHGLKGTFFNVAGLLAVNCVTVGIAWLSLALYPGTMSSWT